MQIGFDNEKYLKVQSEKIKERIKMFDQKLYLEFGGKIFDDYHAERVLPGFQNDAKIRLIDELKDISEIIFCINANNIEKRKIRADYGITYDLEVLRLIENIQKRGIKINSVVITMYTGQESALKFQKRLENKNIKTYIHTPTKGYPTDVNTIVSEKGYGKNPYIETTRPLVIVTAPGPCSGKLATCLSQLYHEYKRGIKAGYAKFETFPVWNLPLKHPVNMAYEAATADLKDVNMIDYFHLESYKEKAVNYNRDLEVFPVLKDILHKITGKDIYKSPTNMGVNMIKSCIINDEACQKAAKDEIIRRYYKALCDYKQGECSKDIPERILLIMNELNLKKEDRKVVKYALEKANTSHKHAIALEIEGKIITGRQTDLLTPVASLFLNTIKTLENIPDNNLLLAPNILKPISEFKINILKKENYRLNLQEVIIALNICSVTNPIIEKAMKNISKFKHCQAHATYNIQNEDLTVLRNFGVDLTCEPVSYSNNLYNED